ncbi:hypothetical protein EHQ64_12630 [Leptospira sarikeiensis]|uniref:Uncharacterized protein n=2 Tax=Leptospira sarikeiensis TaxID=2484943 RepID=A0A4R9K4Q1_9LEPT|nr:hypothetical protein EHQ64_12630 [Leptospira sarikeiensis]
MTKYLQSKSFLTLSIVILSAILGTSICFFFFYDPEIQVFVDRFEFKNLSRNDAERLGILGLPSGVSDYFIKRCAFRGSWLVYSKYKIQDPNYREKILERFKQHPGLNKRSGSYPQDWPQNFDKGNCKPDWWDPCPSGLWAEIAKEDPIPVSKNGFYLCESDKELRWFVFHFRNTY